MRTDMHQFLADADRLGAVIESVSDWSAPTPCDEWDAAALLDHIISSQRDVLIGRGANLPEETVTDPAARWLAHRAAIEPILADDELVGAVYQGYFGPTTLADTLTRFYGFDLLVHRWDLAVSQGLDAGLTESELARVDESIDGFGSTMYEMGISKPPLPTPADSPAAVRVLARVGRAAG